MKRITEFVLLLIIAFAILLLFRNEDYNVLISVFLSVGIVISFFVARQISPFLKILSRIFIGIVFIFSGYVKLVDPLGSMYKFEDYFIALNLDFMMPAALALSMILSIAEVLIGLALLFRLRMRFTAWVLLLFMLFFMPLTAWLAITNAVTDCGCFGDVLVLSNWQTFYKNLVFMPFVILIFANRKGYGWRMRPVWQWVSIAAFALAGLFVSIYAYRHLPLHDFRAWAVGEEIMVPEPTEVLLVYQNNVTGETREWKSAELPWDDSLWVTSWSYKETRTVSNEDANSNYFSLQDEYGTDVAQSILLNPGYQLLLVAPDVLAADRESFDALNLLYEQAEESGVGMAAAISNLPEELEPFRHEVQAMYPFYQADDITLKTLIRSNPGLVLLHNGTILDKWHHNDMPSFEAISNEYLNTE